MLLTVASATVLSFHAVPAASQSVEGDAAWNLRMIGAQTAHDRGYTGAGVTVGVLDSGVDFDHPEFRDRISDFTLNAIDGGPGVSDPEGHGTHVSGIIAAARDGRGTQGVAHDAVIMPLQIGGDSLGQLDRVVETALRAGLQNGTRIFNNSWGYDFYIASAAGRNAFETTMARQTAAFRAAVAQDAVIVVSTGNESELQPNVQAGLPFYARELQPNWLAVTAVGPTGLISSYANRCGRAADWCLAAPGGEIPEGTETTDETYVLSTLPGGLYGPEAGTSMAAPHVTGAVAVARQMLPNASGAALTRLTLATATDVGAPGVDDEYGWGLLNLANLAMTRDAVAASTFANGLWAADQGQAALIQILGARMSAEADGGAWGAVLAATGNHDSTGSANAAEAESLGFLAGFDLAASEAATLGLAFTYVRTDMTETGLRNAATVEALGVSGYGAVRRGAWFVRGAAGAEAVDHEFERGSIVGAAGTVLAGQGLVGRARSGGYSAYADARVGRAFPTSAGELRPFLHGRVQHLQLNAFEEAADIFSLAVREIDQTRFEAGPGVELALTPFQLGGARMSGELGARYAFSAGDDGFETPALFLGSPVDGGIGSLGDAATVSAALRARFSDRLEAGAEGFWSTSDRADQGGVAVGLRLRF